MAAHEPSSLLALVMLIDRVPLPIPPRRGRGRPPIYRDRLFLKALVIMIVRHVRKVHLLLAVLAEPSPDMARLRARLVENGRCPSRRTWKRRLAALPETLPAQIGRLGRCLVDLLQPWAGGGRAAPIDSTALRTSVGVWPKKDRERVAVPHTAIDTDAHWTKSGWHGWIYGWKVHLVVTVAAVWIPLAAAVTPTNVADNEEAVRLLPELPDETHYLLGDVDYDDPALREQWTTDDRALVTRRRGRYPHRDGGVGVHRVFHHLRPHAIKNPTSSSRPSSPATSRFPPTACGRRGTTSSAPSSSTNSCCSIASSRAGTSTPASKPACVPPVDL